MLAILRREFSAYFRSPIGYIYLAVFYIFSGFFFFTNNLFSGYSSITGVYSSLFSIIMFLIPILTMRLMSEDKKQKTDQALLTAPISLFSLVMGKFLAALCVFCMGLAVTLVYAFVIAIFTTVAWSVVFGNLIGTILLATALIAIGMFISTLTENQVIAAVGGFAVMLFLMLIDNLKNVVTNTLLQKIVTGVSFYERYTGFVMGKFNYADAVFYLSVAAIFIFLTIRVIERRRWS